MSEHTSRCPRCGWSTTNVPVCGACGWPMADECDQAKHGRD